MRMEMHQGMRLEQRQILSQQLIQNMELLQVPILQLSELIMQEVAQNPALELKDENEEDAAEEAPAPADEADFDPESILTEIESQRDFRAASRSGPSAESLDGDRADMIQNLSAEAVSLQQHLLAQLRDADVSDELRLIVENLINSLDERGYLRISPQDAATLLSSAYTGVEYDDLLELVRADLDRYSIEAIVKVLQPRAPDLTPEQLTERVRGDLKNAVCEALAVMFERSMPGRSFEALRDLVARGVAVLQGFDPPGVGAIDTRESFLLQLNPKHADYARQKFLVEHHLDDIIHNRIPRIAKDIMETPQAQQVFGWNASIDPEQALAEINEAVEDLKRLNPSPGRTFSGQKAVTVTPDIIVKQVDGELEIILEESYLPPVTLSSWVVEMARKGKALSKEDRDFVRKKVEDARRIIQAIEQRRTTLVRITRALMDKQADFLETGVEGLKPLTMTDLARELGVHVSTVARAVKDKYVQTPRGIYSMRFFFAAAAPAGDGAPAPAVAPNGQEPDERTRGSVIDKIREIVQSEDKREPLSDKQIGEKLEALLRLKLKRRTVAKYREAAGILSSRFRKTF